MKQVYTNFEVNVLIIIIDCLRVRFRSWFIYLIWMAVLFRAFNFFQFQIDFLELETPFEMEVIPQFRRM